MNGGVCIGRRQVGEIGQEGPYGEGTIEPVLARDAVAVVGQRSSKSDDGFSERGEGGTQPSDRQGLRSVRTST